MEIYSPDRPTCGGSPCFLNGHIVIPDLNLRPNPDGLTVYLSVMLPIHPQVAGRSFVSTWYATDVPTSSVPQILADYIKDPELTLETLFKDKVHTLGLREFTFKRQHNDDFETASRPKGATKPKDTILTPDLDLL